MTKKESISQELKKAVDRLKEALLLDSDNIINQDASIQRFEFTFELSWKFMQEILIDNRINTSRGVKTIIRDSANLGIINDHAVWFKYLDDRNLTAHTYKEDEVRNIYKDLKDFPILVDSLIEKSKNFI